MKSQIRSRCLVSLRTGALDLQFVGTHNANLVINTDADQVIVAAAGPNPTGDLRPISYVAGGLEDASIREAVCDILEGGEEAFRERARRLRVRLERYSRDSLLWLTSGRISARDSY